MHIFLTTKIVLWHLRHPFSYGFSDMHLVYLEMLYFAITLLLFTCNKHSLPHDELS